MPYCFLLLKATHTYTSQAPAAALITAHSSVEVLLLQGIAVKRAPHGPLLTGLPALSLTISSRTNRLNVTVADCEHLQLLRVREDFNFKRCQAARLDREAAKFTLPPFAVWVAQLRVLDLGDLDLYQTAPLPALTHLICSFPNEQPLLPSMLPALQQLILTNLDLDPSRKLDTMFSRLHEFKVSGYF